MRSSTSATCRTEIAAVGSSISTIFALRQPRAGDRDRLPLPARHLPHEIARPGLGFEFAEQFAGALGHRLVVEPAERPDAALDLAAQEHIGRGRQVVAEREVLIDDLDALLARLDRLVKMDRFAVDADFAVGGGKLPAMTLTSVDLPAPLSPIRPRTSPASSVRSTSFSA